MRFKTEFNYILKIRDGQGLPAEPKEGETYEFEKTIERVYPLNLPILLVDDDHNVYGKVVILSYTTGNGNTKGTYKIVRLFDEAKRKVFTEDMLDTIAIVKG